MYDCRISYTSNLKIPIITKYRIIFNLPMQIINNNNNNLKVINMSVKI